MPFRTVLVVDDDETILRAYVRNYGAERRIVTATSRATALLVVRDARPGLAVVDYRLGQENGIDLLRELKTLNPGLTIAFVSGYLSVALTMEAVNAGASAVAFKPVTLPAIFRLLDKGHATREPSGEETPTLARIEWEHITRVLLDCGGNITIAARRLGMHRQSLQRKLRKRAPRA